MECVMLDKPKNSKTFICFKHVGVGVGVGGVLHIWKSENNLSESGNVGFPLYVVNAIG